MNVDDIRTLVAYNSWANRRLLEVCRVVPSNSFVENLRSSHGSLRDTLLHIINGESKWYRFWRGLSYDEVLHEQQYPDISSVERLWTEIEAGELEFVATLTDQQLLAKSVIRNREYTLAEMFQHTLNHSTYHRGQIATLLRQLGQTPPATDFRLFLDERNP
jgi:uncharacterized damage-inducible protein DinB